MTQSHGHSHFEGKGPLEHVVEAQGRGLIASAEPHGEVMPGHYSAAADALRETALLFLIIWDLLLFGGISSDQAFVILGVGLGGWLIWKAGRAAWIGYQQLERLHRIMEQERWEIEHHRQQERDELAELYRAKGFSGKLLEDVLDVLMADDERLLKVMLEEELGLQLERLPHPMQQCIGAALGGLFAAGLGLLALSFVPPVGVIASCLTLMGLGGLAGARFQGNYPIPAVVWNIGFGALAYGLVHFLMQQLLG